MPRPPKIPSSCPSCGAAKVLPIMYGLPSPEGMEKADRGDVLLGGCLVDDSFPTWKCTACGHSDGVPFGPVDEELDTLE